MGFNSGFKGLNLEYSYKHSGKYGALRLAALEEINVRSVHRDRH